MSTFDKIENDYISITDFAKSLKNEKTGKPISEDRVRKLIPHIKGAEFFANQWWIPKGSEDPRKHWGRPKNETGKPVSKRKYTKKVKIESE